MGPHACSSHTCYHGRHYIIVTSVLEAAHHQAVHSAPEHENGYLRKRIVAQAPGLARTAVLGFILWTAYDIAIEHLSERQTHKSLGSTVWISMVAGGSAGALHGVLTGATDKFFFPQLAVADRPSRLGGVTFSHGLSHMAMFATYQSIRAYVVDNREWHPMAGIVAAGAVSGVAVDVVSHLTAPFEHVALYGRTPPQLGYKRDAISDRLGWIAPTRVDISSM
ncbi:hypothetical protein, variant [Aphanomyces astaci]|uniref:Uncharacterized protein n=1 Tax=Aphanomyces astaci TaxID=112090 RepID=W4GTE9_APHAT|nr:hypothetical protein, variant [Aphanomyces astaci]ETV82158.1 hypothetical protein, variant [Aphanomyces astaci]|eukprot:XP_009827827.1 hypothetical protein, variant [Aphanomyces astaci]